MYVGGFHLERADGEVLAVIINLDSVITVGLGAIGTCLETADATSVVSALRLAPLPRPSKGVRFVS